MQQFANPRRFLGLFALIEPWAWSLTASLLAIGLYLSLAVAPQDYQQGETVRIMFVHVPAAWMSPARLSRPMAVASAVATSSSAIPSPTSPPKAAAPIAALLHLRGAGHRLAVGRADVGHLVGVGRAPHLHVPCCSCSISATSPSGTRGRRSRPEAARLAAIVALVGAVNLPIVKFWSTGGTPCTSRQACSHRRPEPSPGLLTPLLVMGAAYLALFITLHLTAIRAEIMARACARWSLPAPTRCTVKPMDLAAPYLGFVAAALACRWSSSAPSPSGSGPRPRPQLRLASLEAEGAPRRRGCRGRAMSRAWRFLPVGSSARSRRCS